MTRTEHDGSITVLIDQFDGRPLNAPKRRGGGLGRLGVVHRSRYGIMSDYEGRAAALEFPTAVDRLDPDDGRADPVISDLGRPNGLCFPPDESRLYVVNPAPPAPSTSAAKLAPCPKRPGSPAPTPS